MPNRSHKIIPAHRVLDMLLRRPSVSPSLKPPGCDGLTAIRRGRIKQVGGILIDPKRIIADVLDQRHAIQDALPAVLQEFVRRPAKRSQPEPHLAKARTNAFAEQTVDADESTAVLTEPRKRLDRGVREMRRPERPRTPKLVEAHPRVLRATHSRGGPEQSVVLARARAIERRGAYKRQSGFAGDRPPSHSRGDLAGARILRSVCGQDPWRDGHGADELARRQRVIRRDGTANR